MATQINHVLTVNLQNWNQATAVADRTFTTTRLMRLFDVKFAATDNDPAGNIVLTVANGVNTCMTVTATPMLVVNRLGQADDANTVNDAFMAVAAGGTIVLDSDSNELTDANVFCYSL